MRQKKRAEELQEKRLAKLLPRCQRAPGASCLKDIQRALMKNAYRRVEAVFDDVARVYRDSAQSAKDGKDPELLSSALCVQLCFEVMVLTQRVKNELELDVVAAMTSRERVAVVSRRCCSHTGGRRDVCWGWCRVET
jgi:hypothetical protein